MIKLKVILSLLVITFSSLSFADLDLCSSTEESQNAMVAYLVLDVQGSKSMALYILQEIQKIKESNTNTIKEISGNAYVLKLSKNGVELETEYADPTYPGVVDGVLITKHSLCEFEAILSDYMNKLK